MPDTSGALLTVAEMARADALTIEGGTIKAGTSAEALMARAGAEVATQIRARFPCGNVAVLAGTGGNGGDGFVIARLLAEAGWTVRVGLAGTPADMRGAPRHHADLYKGKIEPLSSAILADATLVVDALYGAGLSRPIEGAAAETLDALRAMPVPVVAVDVPSGLDGDTGRDLGAAPATLTVTFFRRKPGHILLPGRVLCGEVVVRQIGISRDVLDTIRPQIQANGPSLWRSSLPIRRIDGHKYTNGHALVSGGAVMTGAARLAARAAARVGAGLVTIAAPAKAWPIYAAALTSIMVASIKDDAAFHETLSDPRLTGLLIGPGAGVNAATATRTLAMLATGRPAVLDADVFSTFAKTPNRLFAAISGPVVMTPHAGEFARLFDTASDRLSAARTAAAHARSVIVLKGPDTIVAHPDGRAAINENAPPTLATAGSGDVLGGIILGLLTQGMPEFEAACAGVWMHGEAASGFGPGLLAEDLPDRLPGVLARLAQMPEAGQL